MVEPREEWHFDTGRVGRRVLVFDELDSTNATALGLASRERERPELGLEGLAILAENQTAGRGRFHRVWQSRPGSGLLLSVVLNPPLELRRASILTALAAVAVAEAVYRLTSIQARIKWPNDLLVRGKKICGILIEQSSATVVGIGLNLNQTREEFDGAGLPEATSLAIISGREVNLRRAAEVVLRCFDLEYERLIGGERVAVEADWKWRTGLLGQHVEIERSDGTRVLGRIKEMGFDGIEVERPDGAVSNLVPETIEHIRVVG